LSFEEGGNPVVSNRIIAGHDPLLLDSFCAELIGYHPDDIEYLTYAKKIGIGKYYSNNTEILELNTENKSTVDTRGQYAAERYQRLIDEDAACSACYSSLIYALHRMGGRVHMDEKLHIGQGFRNKSGKGMGIGTCALGFSKNVKGCPPKATDIIEALRC
jgi:hypothetical protein